LAIPNNHIDKQHLSGQLAQAILVTCCQHHRRTCCPWRLRVLTSKFR
jgi:hypothetical protein